jgi:hypothetical protein
VVNLGAGYDTLYWRLKKSINEAPTPSVGDQFQKFVEVDFSTVTAKKIHQIQRKKITNKHHIDLSSYFSEPGRNSFLLVDYI